MNSPKHAKATTRGREKMLRNISLLALLCSVALLASCALKQRADWRTAPLQIEVVADGVSAVLVAYAPSPAGRQEVLRSVGFVGKHGVSADKKEADGKTPSGMYSIKRAFGLAENPGTHIPYTQVSEDDVWVDDAESRYYNQWAKKSFSDKDWKSAEALADEKVAYQYAAVIEYNTKNITSGAGSAIFLHCTKGTPTQGCVSIPQEDMRKLLLLMVDGTQIAIAASEEELQKIVSQQN